MVRIHQWPDNDYVHHSSQLINLLVFLFLPLPKDDLVNLSLPESSKLFLLVKINQANFAPKIRFTIRFLNLSLCDKPVVLLVLLMRSCYCCLSSSVILSALKQSFLFLTFKINWFIWHRVTPFISLQPFIFDGIRLWLLVGPVPPSSKFFVILWVVVLCLDLWQFAFGLNGIFLKHFFIAVEVIFKVLQDIRTVLNSTRLPRLAIPKNLVTTLQLH